MKKILFIDDEPSLLELAPLLFSDYEVLASDNIESIFKLIKDFSPDIIFIDKYMGEFDGVTICKMVKADPETLGIPVILMSAGFFREKDKESGADAYLDKPFDNDKLFTILEELTSSK